MPQDRQSGWFGTKGWRNNRDKDEVVPVSYKYGRGFGVLDPCMIRLVS